SGKLVVATSDAEMPALSELKARAEANGVESVELVDRAFIARREPAVGATVALFSHESGVVDAEALVAALLRLAETAGVVFLRATRIVGADSGADGIAVRTERETIQASVVVNAAGLYADEVSAILGGERFTIYPCRGEYAELAPARRALV